MLTTYGTCSHKHTNAGATSFESVVMPAVRLSIIVCRKFKRVRQTAAARGSQTAVAPYHHMAPHHTKP